jgi:hypothetical protein
MNFRMKSFFSPPSAESSTPASSGRDYEKKNKLMEKKSWAKTAISKCMQARFICLAYNLMTLFEHVLDREGGITDEKVHAKKKEAIRRGGGQYPGAGREAQQAGCPARDSEPAKPSVYQMAEIQLGGGDLVEERCRTPAAISDEIDLLNC